VYPSLLRHRVCAPEHRALVLASCRADRRVLPRWHQADRGVHQRRYGHHEYADPGAYTGVTAWTSRDHWLAVIVPVAYAAHPELARRFHIDYRTLIRFCTVKSGYADPRTGRRCIVRPQTIASVLGCTTRTVQTYNAYLRALGLEVVITTGRMLTYAEKMLLWRRGRSERGLGSRQRGLSTEVALTIPSTLRASAGHFIPGSTSPSGPSHLTFTTASLSGQATAEPASPALRPRRRPRRDPSPGYRLAKRLKLRLSWLQHEQTGRIAPALNRFAAATPAWTADDVVNALATVRLRAGFFTSVDPERIRTRPAILLAYWLRQIDLETDHPRLHHLEPQDLRCHRPECDHGWVYVDQHQQELHEFYGDTPSPVTRCTHCRPGAWPVDHAAIDLLGAGDEPPF